MQIAVIDTETTGVTDQDQVCELAVVALNSGERIYWESTLVRPTCSVSPQARAVHHIKESDLLLAMTMKRVMKQPIASLIRGADYVVAHSAEFDVSMLAQSGFDIREKKIICTWRCALHLWPDAPAHGNQVLRYWLGLDIPTMIQPPHRALPDAVVTSALLIEMLKLKTPEELHELTSAPILLKIMKFGKYRGMEWREVRLRDRGYLSWILSKDFGPDEKHTARHWLRKKKEEIDGEDSEVLPVREGPTRDLSEETGGSTPL